MSTDPRPRFVVLHGPNLNLLGEREPEIYGQMTLAALDASLRSLAEALGVAVECAQANGEGALVEALHTARTADGIVINPGGYTHTSVALHDAIRACRCPVIEVHLSNLYGREAFRRESVTGAACVGVVMGLGINSYHLALRHLAEHIGRTVG